MKKQQLNLKSQWDLFWVRSTLTSKWKQWENLNREDLKQMSVLSAKPIEIFFLNTKVFNHFLIFCLQMFGEILIRVQQF